MMEKLLPCNIDAERGVLGSVLIDPKALPLALDLIRADDFYREAHRAIFAAMADLFTTGVPVDLITLCDELERRGELDDVEGTSGVSALANQVPTSRNVKHYAQIVQRTAILRRIIDMGGQAAGIAFAQPDADAAYEQVMKMLLDLGRRVQTASNPPRSFGQVLDRVLADILRRMDHDEVPGVRTGFRDLDRAVLCFEPGNLIYIVGRPADGKTSLAQKMALNMAAACRLAGEGHVDYLTLEMSDEEIGRRMMGLYSETNTLFMRAGFKTTYGTDYEAFQAFNVAVQQQRAEFDAWLTLRNGPMSTAQVRAHALQSIAEHGTKVLFVDQLSKLTDRVSRGEQKDHFAYRSDQLKQIAKELNIVIVCLAQLRRSSEGKRPTQQDIKEAGNIEEDADMVLALHHPANADPERAKHDETFARYSELHIIKGRDVRVSQIPLRFDGEYTRFSDWPEGVAVPVDAPNGK